MLFNFLAVLPLIPGGPTSQAADPPEVLLRAIRSREPVRSALVRYSLADEAPGFAPSRRYFEFRSSGRNLAVTELPDPDGVRLRDPRSGEPMLGVQAACNPVHEILDKDRGIEWRYFQGYPHLSLHGLGKIMPYVNPSSLGLYSSAVKDVGPTELLQRIRDSRHRWSVTRDGALHRVVGVFDLGDGNSWEDKWLIDANRDCAVLSVTSTEILQDGSRRLLGEAKSDYERVDGRWWPIRVEYRHPVTQIRQVVIVERVELDRPDHPQELTPDVFGIPFGMKVRKSGFAGMEEVEERRYVGGGDTISKAEWELVKDQVKPGLQQHLRSIRSIGGGGAYPGWWDDAEDRLGLSGVAQQPDQWEAYVRRWILKHRPAHRHKPEFPIDEKQVNAAWGILKDCKERAMPLREKLDRLEPARAGALPATSQSLGTVAPGNVVASAPARSPEARRQEGQIERIFGMLKTRLNALLTTNQLRESRRLPLPDATPPLPAGPPDSRR